MPQPQTLDTAIQGSCLCGAVRYEITGHLGIFQYCRCSRCQKTSGSAMAANLFTLPDQFHWIDGEMLIGRFEPAGAKHFATAFCTRCGSMVPWMGKSGKAMVVPAGSLDGHPGIKPVQTIFAGSQAEWFVEPTERPRYEAMPPRKG